MRQYSTTVQQLMTLDNFSIFYLVELVTKNSTLRYTDAPYDLNIAGLGLFEADNGLKGIELPRLSTIVDRENYKVVFVDNEQNFRPLFEEGLTGSDLTVWIGFYNTTENVLSGTEPGHPILNLADLNIAYKGTVDTQGYNINIDDGIVATIECSSPMSGLGVIRAFYTSKDYMRQLKNNDSSFDQVYQGSRVIDLLWGKP